MLFVSKPLPYYFIRMTGQILEGGRHPLKKYRIIVFYIGTRKGMYWAKYCSLEGTTPIRL
jgi:hypothetical protein